MKGKLVKEYAKREGRGKVLRFAFRLLGLDGGPGSGNFGHAGRPGKVGGSQAEEGAKEEATEKGSSGEFSSIRSSIFFKNISKAAKASNGDYKAFVKAIGPEEKDVIRRQYQETGTKEHFPDYVKRVMSTIADEPEAPKAQNKVVNGKDIAETYEYKGAAYRNENQGVIDTEIEDVIHQQGFDGVPKVVSQEEFDKIAAEHPEMPILLRSFSAPNQETLDKYNEMLESGFWYVDCSVGQAQYGQGMYCAGVYSEEVADFKDPSLIGFGAAEYVKGPDGKMYHLDTFEEVDDDILLYADDGDVWLFGNANRTDDCKMYKCADLDEFGKVWIDMETHEFVEEPPKYFNRVRPCEEVDESTPYKRDLYEAKKEMFHYRQLNEQKCHDQSEVKGAYSGNQFEPPKVYEYNCWGDDGKLYKPDGNVEDFDPDKLSPGEKAILYVKYDENDDHLTMMVVGKKEDGEIDFMTNRENSIKRMKQLIATKPTKMQKAVEEKAGVPQSSTRMMTLDPSAKIITHQELEEMWVNGISPKERKSRYEEELSVLDKEAKDDEYDEDSAFIVKYAAKACLMELTQEEKNRYMRIATTMDESDRKELLEYGKNRGRDIFQKVNSEAKDKADRIQRKFRDLGVYAAALGYDAINAFGHGLSNSYTVVLNRTKVILSKEMVDIA